jgi:glycosyltransferase involved in cell wall biosynthesis
MRILVLPSFYPTEMDYPRGSFFEEQTILLRKNGVDAVVLHQESRSIVGITLKKLLKFHFQSTYFERNGVPVYRKCFWNLIPTKFLLGNKIWIWSCFNHLKDYIKKYGKPDLIHAHCIFNGGIVAQIAKEKFDIPFIITEHTTMYGKKVLSNYEKSTAFKVFDSAKSVIVVSNPFKKLLSESIGFNINRINVIPNFIDTDFFNSEISGEIQLQKDWKYIFACSYHIQDKRIDRLIEAFYLIKNDFQDIHLVIGGEGEKTNYLKDLVIKLGLEKSIHFVGFLLKDKVRDYMAKSIVFCLPSDVETFGVVLIEALSLGIPIISTKCGGPEDIINGEVGILAEKSTDSIKNALLFILNNRKNYDKEKLRRYVLNNFSGNVVTKKYIDLYTNCCTV